GGSAKWVEDYARADSQRANLILRPYSHDRAMAGGVALFAAGRDEPLKAWPFAQPIVATVLSHPEYKQALGEILRSHRVDVLVVSSLSGRARAVLDTGLPTLMVNQAHEPDCPAS